MIKAVNYENRTVQMEISFDLYEVLNEANTSFLLNQKMDRLMDEVVNHKKNRGEDTRTPSETQLFLIKDERARLGQDLLENFVKEMDESELGKVQTAVNKRVSSIGELLCKDSSPEGFVKAHNVLEGLLPEMKRVTSFPELTTEILYLALKASNEEAARIKEAEGE